MIITGLLIGGVVGLVSSAPFAAVYAKKALNDNNMEPLQISSRTDEHDSTVVSDNVQMGRVSIKSTSVYRNESGKAAFDLIFKMTVDNVPQIGIGILPPEITWVGEKNTSKVKKTTHTYMKTRVFLLDQNDELVVPVTVDDEKHMQISHVKMKIYEGGVGKTHNIQLKVNDYTYVDR